MSDLPTSWAWSTIGDLSQYIQRGKSPKYADKSELPVINQKCIRWNELQMQYLKFIHPDQFSAWDSARYIAPGDILWNSTGTGTVGRAYQVKEADCVPPKVVDSHVTIVRHIPGIDPRYLFNWIKGPLVQGKIEEMCDGTTNQIELSRTAIAATAIPIAPAAEQSRIANQLDTLLARVQACNDRFDAIPALLKRFRQTVLDAATTGQLTDAWRMNNLGQVTAEEVVSARLAFAGKRPTKAAAEFFANHHPAFPQKGVLPDTWLLTHIGMVGTVSNGSTPSRQEPLYWGSGIPWVSSGEVANGVIRRTREQITNEGFKNSSVRLLPRGSVLMAMIGEGKTRGQSAILDIDACINQNIAGVVPVDGILDSKYLWFWFRREYENTRTKGNGSGPKALNCERVRELEINLPPLAEQSEIVRRVEALFALADRIEARCSTARAQAQRLSPLVLAKAFRGELVPQDPNDEPASALLARIAPSNTAVAEKNRQKVPVAPNNRARTAINL